MATHDKDMDSTRAGLHEAGLYAALFQGSAIPMLVADTGGRIVAVNRCWSNLAKRCAQDPGGAEPAKLVDDALGSYLGGLSLSSGGPPQSMSLTLPEVDGNSCWQVNATWTPVQDQGQYLLIALHELDDQALELQRINVKHHQLRSLIDNAPVLVFVKDRERRMMIANRETSRLFALHEGQLDSENMSVEDAAAVHRLDDEVAASAGPQSVEEALHTTAGLRHFSTVKFPLHDAVGSVIGVGGIAQDITEKVLVERENARLLVSERAAREADRVKSEFLATMSHEIRTPLAGIIGLVNILIETCNNDFERGHLRNIHASSTMLLRVLNDVLDFSKLEANKFTLESISFDLHALLETTCATLQGAASAKGVQLRVQLDAQLPRYVVSDAGRLAQVVNNLVNNAIKFSSRGVVTVRAECAAATDQDNLELRVEVADEGIGMSDEDLKKLFVAFSQADNSIARRFGGSGLGLAISKGIIVTMGGQVKVTSVLGQGSVFSFSVPVRRSRSQVDETAKDGGREVLKLKGRILVAEDNAINRTVISHQLNKLGLKVVLATDGTEAYRLACDEDFDLILMDCHMPHMDGFEATARIRSSGLQKAGSIAIVALTANAVVGERQRCLDAQMTDYLVKPVPLQRLYDCLSQYLDKSV